MTLLRSRRGMTLVEIVISTVIVTAIAATLFAVSDSTLTGWHRGTSRNQITDYTTVGLQKLGNDIRDGRLATASGDHTTLTVTFPLLLTDAGTGERTYDPSADNATPRIYYVSDGNLVRSVGGSVTILQRGVTSAEFNVSHGTVSVTLQSDADVGTRTLSQTAKGQITLRNHRGS